MQRVASGKARLAWHKEGLKGYYRRYFPAYIDRYFKR